MGEIKLRIIPSGPQRDQLLKEIAAKEQVLQMAEWQVTAATKIAERLRKEIAELRETLGLEPMETRE